MSGTNGRPGGAGSGGLAARTEPVTPAAGPGAAALSADRGPEPATGTPVDLNEVIEGTARLLDLVRRSSVSRLSLAVGTVRWEIETGSPATAPAASAPAAAGPEPAEEPPGHHVLAPLVGVFYGSPRPGTPPFVTVGDRVQVGQQVAIVEAMKMMNEIVCDRAGIVREVHVQNEAIVEFGERLFTLEPIQP